MLPYVQLTKDVNSLPAKHFECKNKHSKVLLGEHSTVVPPDPFPNSEVKRSCADGSVGSPHVRVGHRQAPN